VTEPAAGETPASPPPTTLPPTTLAPTTLERLIAGYRETASSRTALTLLAANAIPLVGVLFLGWSLWTILAIYWVENGIVGLWNIPRILLAEGQLLPGRSPGVGYRPWAVTSVPAVGRTGLAVFFTFHYGLFWLVHGVFVLVLPQFMSLWGNPGTQPGVPTLPGPGLPFMPEVGTAGQAAVGPFGALDWSAVGVAGIGLFLSHGASFAFNYLGRGEFRRTWAAAQMLAPYGRVVTLHLTILLGGFAIAFLGAPVVMLLVLVAMKTAFDLSLHLREHRPAAIAALSESSGG
jgi:hypothetical protein